MYTTSRRALRVSMSMVLVTLLLMPGAAIAQAPLSPSAASAPTAASAVGMSAAAVPGPNKTDKAASAAPTPPRPYDGPSRRTRSWIYAAIVGTVGVIAVILLARHYHNNRGCDNCLPDGM